MKKFSRSSASGKTGILLFILSGLLMLYVCVRAYCLAITWDEAYCYLEFCRKGLFSPFYFSGISANNHLLNTWLIYLTSSLFGVSEFTLRLPNVLAYLLFLFYTAKISSRFSSHLLRISSFLILNLNPYLVDFFSLSRGYGLSYGFLAGSVWYLYLFVKSNFQKKYSLRSLIFAMIAVIAYLALIHFAIALVIIIFLTDFLFTNKELSFLKRFFSVLKKNRVAALLFLIFLAIVILRITGLKNADALFYGGTSGFWNDTVVTVFERSLYGIHYPDYFKYLLSSLALSVSIIAFYSSVKMIYKKKYSHEKVYFLFLFFLFVYCSLISVLQHHIFQTPYLTNRTALFLLVLFLFVFVFLLNEIAGEKKILKFILPVICLLSGIHFYNSFNLKYVLEYNLNADTKAMIHDIDSLKKEFPPEKFSMDVGVSYDFLESVNYYRCVYNLSWLNLADKSRQLDPVNDFYLFTKNDFRKAHRDSFLVIKTYPLFKSMLLKKKYKPSHYTICLSKKLDFESSSDSMPLAHATSPGCFSGKTSGFTDEKNEYSDGISYKIDLSKTPAKNSIVMIKAMVWMEQLSNTDAGIVVSFENKNKIYDWHLAHVVDFAPKPGEWFPVYITGYIPEEVQQDDLLMIYLWNKNSPVNIDDIEMRWISGVY
jgi:hypothetical protein